MSNKTTARNKSPEYLADFLMLTSYELIQAGMSEEAAAELANNIAKKMCQRWQKQMVYFPTYDNEERLVRNAQIFQEINGRNFDDVARKYNLSLQAVYAIYKSVLKEQISSRQQTLEL